MIIYKKHHLMKKIILFVAFALLVTQGCQKEVFEEIPFSQAENKEYQITFETPEEMAVWFNDKLDEVRFDAEMFEEAFARSRRPLCYNTEDLLSFISQYRTRVPDFIPVWNNYFQDVNCFDSRWEFFLYERQQDGTAPPPAVTELVDNVEWNVSGAIVNTDGDLQFATYFITEGDTILNPNCPGTFQPPCNGGHEVVVTVTIGGATYQRSNISFGGVNNVPASIAPLCTELTVSDITDSGQFDQDCPCPTVFDSYEFLLDSGLEWDLDNDGVVELLDLLIFFENYGC